MKLLDIEIILALIQITFKQILKNWWGRQEIEELNPNEYFQYYHTSKEETLEYHNITVNIDHLTDGYTEQTIDKAIQQFKEQVDRGQALGELGNQTDPLINLMNISHRVTRLELVNKTLNIDIEVLDNNSGRKLNDILLSYKTKFQCRTVETPTNFLLVSIDGVEQ